jgi:hypothetical protein
MSKMSQISKLQNHFKSEQNNIFEIGQMLKVAQNFSKIEYFLLPSNFTVHANDLGKRFRIQ